MAGKIQNADPTAKQKAIRYLVIGTIIGSIIIFCIQLLRGRLTSSNSEQFISFLVQHHYLIFVALFLLTLPLILLMCRLIKYAKAVIAERRFPPANIAVFKDTTVVEGVGAVRKGKIVIALCCCVVIMAVFIPFYIWYLFYWVLSAT
jgi:tellurite resistance protein TehA-like permease